MLSKNTLLDICQSLKSCFAEVRIRESFASNIQVQDGKALKLSSANSLGAGIRVLKNGSWGFVSCENISEEDSIHSAIKNALSMAVSADVKWTEDRSIAKIKPSRDIIIAKVKIDPKDVPFSKKIDKLMELERAAAEYSPVVVNTVLNYIDLDVKEIIINSLGTYVEQSRIRTRVTLLVTAYDKGVRQSSYNAAGSTKGFEAVEALAPGDFSRKAASKAVALLKASNPPSGKFPVVLSPQIVGVFAHEAVGHNAEADLVKSGNSILENKIGNRIGSEKVSIVDDPTVEDAYGSYVYDSEGTRACKTVIIEKGVLKSFLHNLETAHSFGTSTTGNARAAGYAYPPLVRMSNTYILPGKANLSDLFSTIKKGVFVEDEGFGGYVLPERGQFMFNANSSYLIENGRKTKLLKNVSLTGLTLETLGNVEEVSKEFAISGIGGTCGKGGQGVPVDEGGPYVKVRDMLVGGR